MRKVVIVAYNFPPVGGAGVQRPVKFVKYLKGFGWQPIVLAVANPSVPVVDESLLLDIPDDVTIYKAKTLEPSYAQKQSMVVARNCIKGFFKRHFKSAILSCMLPDMQILWWPDLILKLVKVIKYENPDCIFVTAPPFSSFLPVILLGSICKIPVVIDFRDEWSFSRNTWENTAKHSLATIIDKLFESYVVRKCTAFTAVNSSYISTICKTYPKVDVNKGSVITNGYDEDDFRHIHSSCLIDALTDKINFVYTGTVWNATSFKPFISALKSLLSDDPTIADKIHLKIYGRVVDSEMSCFKGDKINNVLNLFDYCRHDLSVQAISNADILILTLSELPGSHKIIAGKIFEYMATGKHILAIIPDGETKNIIEENYSNCTIVKPESHAGICIAIRYLIDNFEKVKERRGDDVSKFSRRILTGRLAEVLDYAANS